MFVLVVGAPAWACPDPSQDGEEIVAPAGTSHEFAVVAGGDGNVAYCGIAPENHPGALGFFADAPTFTLQRTDGGDAAIAFRVDGDCDAVLLVSAGPDAWWFDDDEGGERKPLITVAEPPDGPLDIWVGGFFEPTTCDAILTVEASAN
jgi:hypothetical protein